jgi:methionyl-tRNA formyltransferase
LGFEFDYGFDLSWDNDPGNISRFDSICSLIDKLNDIGIYELIDLTKKSTDHNKKFITTGGFQTLAEKKKYNEAKETYEKKIQEAQGLITKKDSEISGMRIEGALLGEVTKQNAYNNHS